MRQQKEIWKRFRLIFTILFMIEAPRFFSVQCNHYLGTIPLVYIVNQWTVFFRGASLDWKELKVYVNNKMLHWSRFLYSCNSCRNHSSFKTERHLLKNIFKKASVKIIKITVHVVVHFHFETTLLFKLTKADTTIITSFKRSTCDTGMVEFNILNVLIVL